MLSLSSSFKGMKKDYVPPPRRRRVSWQEGVVVLGDAGMSSETKHAANEFEILSFLENGINSKVYDVVQKQRNRKFTMEVVPRQNTTQEDEQNSRLHRHSHYKAPSHYLTQLKYSFQTKSRKYFVLSHMDRNKTLMALLQKKNTLTETESRFIITEIIVAIETLHEQGIPYGKLTINDIYLDPTGHVLLKRIYNGQHYWTKNECYQCHVGNCNNQYHNGEVPSECTKAHDWNGIGQLLAHIITGKQMLCSTVDNLTDTLSKNARDFVCTLLEDSIKVENVKNHVLLKDTDWERIKIRENDPPDSIKLFVLDVNYKNLKNTLAKNESSTKKDDKDVINAEETITDFDHDDDEGTSRAVVEGARKQRDSGKRNSFKSERTRSKSYNQTTKSKSLPNSPRKMTRSISCSDKSDEPKLLDGNSNIEETKEMRQRKKSIEVYQLRLQEISGVLNKNKNIMQSIDGERGSDDNNKINHLTATNNMQQLTNNLQATTTSSVNGTGETITGMKKISSENDAIRTILSKYGLLKDEDENKKLTAAEEETTIIEKPVKRVRRPRTTKCLSAGNTPRNCSPQISENEVKEIQINEHEQTQTVAVEGSRKTRRKSRSGRLKPTIPLIEKDEAIDEALGDVLTEVQTNQENTKEVRPEQNNSSNQLIDKLNGLSKSKTFYTKKSETEGAPKSSHMKRHQSDPTAKPTVIIHSPRNRKKTLTEQPKALNAPQSLLKILKSASQRQLKLNENNEEQTYSNMFAKEKSISCDSGLNEPNDEDRDETAAVDRNYVERNDSGVGCFNEKVKDESNDEKMRVWKPGNPDISFLQQQKLKHRSQKEDCYDCGKENLEETFPNTLDTLCKKCGKSRIERKEAVIELIETEVNYGEDLRILKEEFYTPIKQNSICTTDEISKLFLNLQELVDVNAKLCVSLQYGLEQCLSQDDDDYMNLGVGEVFLNNVEFFEAYELYCAKQNEALELLTYMQKKSDLLRIFLTVSSQENTKLRKMDLKSFLTMPVQRIMKYPLLLSRILKHTPNRNDDRKTLKDALLKVEEQITKINDLSRGNTLQVTTRVKKTNSFSSLLDLDSSDTKNVIKIVSNLQEWKVEETKLLLQDEFEIIPQDLIGLTTWNKSTFKKVTYLRAVLCVNGAPENYHDQIKERMGNGKSKYVGRELKDAVIVLLKQKYMDKCQIYKDPIKLKECVLSENMEIPVAFEISEKLNDKEKKEPVTFAARNAVTCDKWKTNIRFVIETCQLKWRLRRGGRSNIMIPNSTLEQE